MDELQRAEAILRLAIQTEIDGHEFYTRAAARTTDPAGQDLFRSLAADEVAHRRLLEAQLASLRAGEGWLDHEDLSSHAGHTPMFDPARLEGDVNARTADLSALRMAMLIEADAVAFYARAAAEADDDLARSLFLDLVEMEQGHQAILQREYDFLLGQFRDVMGFAPF